MALLLIVEIGTQGTMTAFAAFTQKDVASLVKKAAMLSPIAYLNHVSSPVASVVSWLFLDKVIWLPHGLLFLKAGS